MSKGGSLHFSTRRKRPYRKQCGNLTFFLQKFSFPVPTYIYVCVCKIPNRNLEGRKERRREGKGRGERAGEKGEKKEEKEKGKERGGGGGKRPAIPSQYVVI